MDKNNRQLGEAFLILSRAMRDAARVLGVDDEQPKATDAGPKPVKPKGPKSSFVFYCMQNREKVKQETGCTENKELLRLLGERWRNLSESEKEPYKKQAVEDKETYDEAMLEYLKSEPEPPFPPKKRSIKKKRQPKSAEEPPVVEPVVCEEHDELDATEDEEPAENENGVKNVSEGTSSSSNNSESEKESESEKGKEKESESESESASDSESESESESSSEEEEAVKPKPAPAPKPAPKETATKPAPKETAPKPTPAPKPLISKDGFKPKQQANGKDSDKVKEQPATPKPAKRFNDDNKEPAKKKAKTAKHKKKQQQQKQ